MNRQLKERQFFRYLLIFRAICAGVAAYFIITSNLRQMAIAIVVLLCILWLSEVLYTGILAALDAEDRRRRRKEEELQRQKALNEQREALAAAQQAATDKYLVVPGFYESAKQKRPRVKVSAPPKAK